MKRLLYAALLLPGLALAEYHPPIEYGVARTIDFVLYTTAGVLDVDEADGGAEITLDCDGTPTNPITNDFVDEGSFYSIALTAAETRCRRITLTIAATDTNVVTIPTFGHPLAQIVSYDPYRFAAVADAAGTTTDTDLTGAASGSDNYYNGNVLRVFDASAGEWYEAVITDYTGSTNIAIHTPIPAAVASGDGLIVMAETKTSATTDGNGNLLTNVQLIEDADAGDFIDERITAADLAQAQKLLAYVQLLARSDAAIGTGRSTELGEINNDEGSGAGDFAATADSLEAAQAERATAQSDLNTITGDDGVLIDADEETGIRDAIMQYTLDNGITFEEAACHMLAVLAGEAAFTAGSPDQTVYQDPTGTDNRVTVQYGSDDGDRTSITLSATNCGSN